MYFSVQILERLASPPTNLHMSLSLSIGYIHYHYVPVTP